MSKLSRPVPLSDPFFLPIGLLIYKLIYKIINQILPGMAWYFSILSHFLIVVFVVCAVLWIVELLRLDKVQIPYWIAVCIMILGVYIVVRFL